MILKTLHLLQEVCSEIRISQILGKIDSESSNFIDFKFIFWENNEQLPKNVQSSTFYYKISTSDTKNISQSFFLDFLCFLKSIFYKVSEAEKMLMRQK